jgi:hypothetical protein
MQRFIRGACCSAYIHQQCNATNRDEEVERAKMWKWVITSLQIFGSRWILQLP